MLTGQQRAVLEQFVGSRVELIRSTHWRCEAPWYVSRRIIKKSFLSLDFPLSIVWRHFY
jgi:hypothetical protein